MYAWGRGKSSGRAGTRFGPAGHVDGGTDVEWVYLILILAFLSWCIQIAFAYKRQAARIDDMVEQAVRTQAQVTEEAERQEAQAEELKARQRAVEERVRELEGKESDLQGRLGGKQADNASRRPTRHRVDGADPTADPPEGG